MFQITDEMLLGNCFPAVFTRGQSYYNNRKIKSVSFNQEQMQFDAVVIGTKKYNVKIYFKENGTVNNAHCTCNACESYWGFCKHIIAVLLLVRDKDEQGFFSQLKYRRVARQIFDFFQGKPNTLKNTVDLEITYGFNRGNNLGVGAYSSVSLRIGEDKLYIVKDIKKLLQSIKNGEVLEFGKRFTYDPAIHTFRPEDKAVLDFLQEFCEIEELYDKFDGTIFKSSVFKDKQVLLAPAAVKRLFRLLDGRTFRAEIQGTFYEKMEIKNEDFPVGFSVTREDRELELGINIQQPLLPLTGDGEYFFTSGCIYRISKRQQENFKPFYIAMLSQNGNKIRFLEEDSERFISEILPFAENAGNVDIDEAVSSLIQKAELEPEVYLDRNGATVSAEVRFMYGNRVINPFSPSDRSDLKDGKILLRDMQKERQILEILEESEFKVKNNQVYLEGDEKAFDFACNIVPKLQQHARVYYSESFKSMSVKSASFSGGMRLNTGTGMLEFSFSLEGVEGSEIMDIYLSLKERKKYYRLRDGSFLQLDSREMKDIAEMLEYLELGKEDFKKDYIEVSQSRALYLDQYLRESSLRHVKRDHAFKEFVQNILEPQEMEAEIPAELDSILREYQKLGFRWLKTLARYNMGGILADDMGLGKTLQIIVLIDSEKKEKGQSPSLIVVPTSLIYNWHAEIQKFAPELSTVLITGSREEREAQMQAVQQADMVITSYPLIRRDIEDYLGYSFRYCIVDEAQYIKNPGSQNARCVKQIRAEKHFALTGTPVENSLTELWSIFDFVLPGYLFSHPRFVQKYEKPIVRDEDRAALNDLSRHIKPFILRRMKTDVLSELPEKIEHRMIAELTDEQKKVYLTYLKQIKGEIDKEIRQKGFERSHIKILSGLTRLRQICCHPSIFLDSYEGESGKLQLLQEVINDCLEGGHRILLFSQFTSMLQLVQNWLDLENIDYFYLDGSTKADERSRLVKAFNGGRSKLFLISLKAGGTGLNLTGADTVIHYDPWWNPAVEDQATDRAYRIGQNKSVHVMKLVTKGTIEEKIYELQEKKKRLVDAVIQPGETMISKMTEDEVRALFE